MYAQLFHSVDEVDALRLKIGGTAHQIREPKMQSNQDGVVDASNTTLCSTFLAELFQGVSDKLLIKHRGRKTFGSVSDVRGLMTTQADELQVSLCSYSGGAEPTPQALYGKVMQVEPGMVWVGQDDLAPTYLIYDDQHEKVVVVWAAQSAVALNDREARAFGRSQMMPLPSLADQLVDNGNDFVDLADPDVLERLSAASSWSFDDEVKASDLETFQHLRVQRGDAGEFGTNRVVSNLLKKVSKLGIKDEQSLASYQAAVRYAAMGLSVFPVYGIDAEGNCSCEYHRKKAAKLADVPFQPKCGAPGKHPKIHKWQDAKPDPLWVTEQWSHGSCKFGPTNVGIVTGPKSGLLLIDVDGPLGLENLRRLEEERGSLPNTPTVRTGGGGLHLYFRYPPGADLHNSVSQFGGDGSKIDVRAEGGYVVAPPSLHASGNFYRWEEGKSLFGIDIAEPPAWCVDEVLRASKKKSQPTEGGDPAEPKTGPKREGGARTSQHTDGSIEPSLRSALANIGDGEGKNGFNGPIYGAANCYFRCYGEDAAAEIIVDLLRAAVKAAVVDEDRINYDRYTSEEYILEQVENARQYVTLNPKPALEAMLPSGFFLDSGFVKRRIEGKHVNVCQIFDVIGWSREGGEDDWSLVIAFKNADGKLVEVSIPKADLFDRPGNVKRVLGGKGFDLNLLEWKSLETILSQIRTSKRIAAYSKPGWHEGTFVCPSGEVIGSTIDELVRYKHRSASCDPMGSLQGSIAVLDAACRSGCSHWMVGALSGGLACLAQHLGEDSCLIALTGETSRGNTTALMLGASWWGSCVPHKSPIITVLNGTENSFEAMIEQSTGIGFFGDELRHMAGGAIQRLIFQLAGGTGKRRLNVDASLKPTRAWQTVGLLSGEVGLANAIREDKTNPANGVMARCLELDVSNEPVVDQHVVQQVTACRENYGFIGPAFVEQVLYEEDADLLRSRLQEVVAVLGQGLASGDGVNASSLKRRAIRVAALCVLVGEVMQRAKLASNEFDFLNSFVRLVEKQVDKQALDPAATALENLRTTLVTSPHVQYGDDMDRDDGTLYRETYAWVDEKVIYVRTDKIEEMAGGSLKFKAILAALRASDVLIEAGSEKNVAFPSVGKMRVRNYRISRRFIDGAQQE